MAGCTILGGVHPVCARFLSHLLLLYSRDPPNDHFTKETTSLKDHFLVRTEYSPLFHV